MDRKSEPINRISEPIRMPDGTMFELLDEMSELIYVADPITYELLYMNAQGLEDFSMSSLVGGQKCFRILQGLDAPCPFCTNPYLTTDQIYSWEFTNPITKRHYLLKDKLINWAGRTVRVEIAFDMTELEEEKQTLHKLLSGQKMGMDCVRELYQSTDIKKTIYHVLERIGTYLSADRAYIFEISENVMNNTYEWCAEGVKPAIEMLQGLDVALIGRWVPYFERHECVVTEDVETLRETAPQEYKTLRAQGIYRLVTAPLEKDGVLCGYLGVDNPPPNYITNVMPTLHTIRYFLMSALEKSRDQELLMRLSYFDTLTGFYNRNRYMQDLKFYGGGSCTFGVVYVDVNGLKDINDRYGHSAGDQLLVLCAKTIQAEFPTGCFYRIGGDEFVVFCIGIPEEQFLQQVDALKQRFSSDDGCSAAVGSHWAHTSDHLEARIADADAQMYEDKRRFYQSRPLSKRFREWGPEAEGSPDSITKCESELP